MLVGGTITNYLMDGVETGKRSFGVAFIQLLPHAIDLIQAK
jgi:hypothetical protein